MTTVLSTALYREVRPEFFRVLAGAKTGRLYVDALDALERAAAQRVQGIERDDALALVEEAVEAHADVPLDEADPASATLSTREKARAVLDTLRRAGWLEDEERSDWQKLVHFHPSGQALMQTLRRLAFPEGVVFSDKLVSVCTTLARRDAVNDPLREEPWQHVESSVAALQEGIAELRGMQTAIERHTRQQLAAATLRENLALLFDQFAERIGHACYAELVRARLPLRLGEARRRVEELEYDAELLGKMQAELLRRESTLSPETAMSRVRLRLEELSDLLQSVVPVADAVDRRTAEFTRRSLARFRYLQETTSESRAHVQEFFETLNRHFAGRRIAELENAGIEFPELRVHDTRLLAGVESLYSPRLRRVAGEIEPLDDEASEDQQDDALRRLRAAMRDSMTVARANRFVEQLLPERKTSIRSENIPLHCEEDLADLIACLLHAHAGDARYRVDVARERTDADAAEYDAKLSYRIERFTLTRK
ncbi:MAG: Wadjet anti-phage system protein JetA family protein [Chthoniobacteraceae bacterium]